MKNSRIRRWIAFVLCMALVLGSNAGSVFVGSMKAAETEALTDGLEEDSADPDTNVVNIEVTTEGEIVQPSENTAPEIVEETVTTETMETTEPIDPLPETDGEGLPETDDPDQTPIPDPEMGEELQDKIPGEDQSEDMNGGTPDDSQGEEAGDETLEEDLNGETEEETLDTEIQAPNEDANETVLTEEEQKQIDAVKELLAALPAEETVWAEAEAFGEDEDALNEYYIQLSGQVEAVYDAYMSLTEDLRQYIDAEQAAYLLRLKEFFEGFSEQLASSVFIGPLTGDEAYIDSIRITTVEDGTEPFDNHTHDDGCYTMYESDGEKIRGDLICTRNEYTDDDMEHYEAGDDRSANNRVVRTFDSVTYDFEVTMKSYDLMAAYNDARVKLEFVLPATEEEAVFDLGAMAWIDTAPGYEAKIEIAKMGEDGLEILDADHAEEADCQVLTCYKHLVPAVNGRSVVPGEFGESVVINVRSMKNGDEFAPIFSAVMEGGTEDGACAIPGHVESEKKSAEADKITVTAAPKYNIRVAGSDSEKRKYEFSETGNGLAANKDKGYVTGRMMKLGISVQLYNDDASKGMKGIELPDGSNIQFDLKLESLYHINQPKQGSGYTAGQEENVIDAYTPLLWSCGPNIGKEYMGQNIDGRPIYDSNWGDGLVPYSDKSSDSDLNSCFASGTWTASQDSLDPSVIHVSIRDYAIDVEHMPGFNRGQDTETDMAAYGAHVGCFSSGVIWIVQPFNSEAEGKDDEDKDPYYDIVETYGEGYFHTFAEVDNMYVKSVSGTEVRNADQRIKTDDRVPFGLELTLPGTLQNRVRYASAESEDRSRNWKGAGIDNNRNGRDFATPGSDIWLMGGFSYYTDLKEENQLYWGTNLTKFYGKAIEPVDGEYYDQYSGGAKAESVKVYYAAKKDGSDWIDDNEMLRTHYEDDLIFYEHLKDLKAAGKICVGILYCFQGPGGLNETTKWPEYLCFHKAKVARDQSLIGTDANLEPKTYMMVSTSRVWTKKMFEDEGKDLSSLETLPKWSDSGTKLADFPTGHLYSGNYTGDRGPSTYYEKAVYASDGSGIKKDHNSDYSHWGDTLLLIGYKTKITKNLMQKNGTEDKKIFNLDLNQRVVDFGLQPETRYDNINTLPNGLHGLMDTVTIIDTLPRHLTYREGSAHMGGTYRQIAANGGMQGEMTGELFEPTVVKNPDGTQTLTWTLENVMIGTPLQPIYYSADIGTKLNAATDVPKGYTSLLNKVRICSKYDRRDPSKANENYADVGISVTRGSATSYGKYALQNAVEKDGKINYIVYYDNNAQTSAEIALVDIMPADQINGSRFDGTYAITDWRVDNKESVNLDKSEIQIYYTADEEYRGITEAPAKEVMEKWEPLTITEDGVIQGYPEEPPVAWGIVGMLKPSSSVNISLEITLRSEATSIEKPENECYVNLLYKGDTTITTKTPVVRRTLEGLTWMDYDQDGRQGTPAEEDRISGIAAELLKLRDGGDPDKLEDYEAVCYPETGEPARIFTGTQISLKASGSRDTVEMETGRYKFFDLPPGTYAVRFTSGTGENGYDISKLKATIYNCMGNYYDETDSDGVPVYESNGDLASTYILGIVMKDADTMYQESIELQESKYHDSGFYQKSGLEIQKVGDDWQKRLTGASFVISGSDGSTVPFIKEGDGTYAASVKVGDFISRGRYYIQYADHENKTNGKTYVMGFAHTDANGTKTVLQEKIKDDEWQLFELFSHEDGTFSFRHCATGRWLDSSGWIENRSQLHLWEGYPPEFTTHENQIWYVTPNEKGSYCIQAKTGRETGDGKQGYIDVENNEPKENAVIYNFYKNDTTAQDWRLVPENDASILYVDENGSIRIKDLLPGSYTITELDTPEGYTGLGHPVNITVNKDGTITVVGEDGPVQMVKVTGDGKSILQVRNFAKYELPSTGGIGIYWYTISGTLLMFAGMLILYKRKCARRC